MRNIAMGSLGEACCHSTRIRMHQAYGADLADSIYPGAWAFHLLGVAGVVIYNTELGLMIEGFCKWRILSRKARSKV